SFQKQYKDKIQAKAIHYQHIYTLTQEYMIGNQISDIFDSIQYKFLVSSGLFSDYWDIALMASTDRY
ncbi:7780_t:CDS:1, partial [Cetraspora pellucida]